MNDSSAAVAMGRCGEWAIAVSSWLLAVNSSVEMCCCEMLIAVDNDDNGWLWLKKTAVHGD